MIFCQTYVQYKKKQLCLNFTWCVFFSLFPLCLSEGSPTERIRSRCPGTTALSSGEGFCLADGCRGKMCLLFSSFPCCSHFFFVLAAYVGRVPFTTDRQHYNLYLNFKNTIFCYGDPMTLSLYSLLHKLLLNAHYWTAYLQIIWDLFLTKFSTLRPFYPHDS